MRSPRWLRAVLAALIALATGFGIAAISAGSAQAATGRTWTVQVGSESPNQMIQGMTYGPTDIWINVGDTVHWVSKTMEPHTVSFVDQAHPAVPFNPANPALAYMVVKTPQTSIGAPGEFRNSGVISTMADDVLPYAGSSYDLTFTGPGVYDYVCYIHGVMMKGTVHVRAAGTAYPHTQQWYNAEAAHQRAMTILDGERLWTGARVAASSHHVFVGASDMTTAVMAFTRSHSTVHVGESITFDWGQNQVPTPHTVTFGPEPGSPFPPVGDPTHYAGGTLSSGFLVLPSSTFTVTFAKAGTYSYLCMLHDHMGMVGTVTVLP